MDKENQHRLTQQPIIKKYLISVDEYIDKHVTEKSDQYSFNFAKCQPQTISNGDNFHWEPLNTSTNFLMTNEDEELPTRPTLVLDSSDSRVQTEEVKDDEYEQFFRATMQSTVFQPNAPLQHEQQNFNKKLAQPVAPFLQTNETDIEIEEPQVVLEFSQRFHSCQSEIKDGAINSASVNSQNLAINRSISTINIPNISNFVARNLNLIKRNQGPFSSKRLSFQQILKGRNHASQKNLGTNELNQETNEEPKVNKTINASVPNKVTRKRTKESNQFLSQKSVSSISDQKLNLGSNRNSYISNQQIIDNSKSSQSLNSVQQLQQTKTLKEQVTPKQLPLQEKPLKKSKFHLPHQSDQSRNFKGEIQRSDSDHKSFGFLQQYYLTKTQNSSSSVLVENPLDQKVDSHVQLSQDKLDLPKEEEKHSKVSKNLVQQKQKQIGKQKQAKRLVTEIYRAGNMNKLKESEIQRQKGIPYVTAPIKRLKSQESMSLQQNLSETSLKPSIKQDKKKKESLQKGTKPLQKSGSSNEDSHKYQSCRNCVGVSSQRRKSRKAHFSAPSNLKRRIMSCHLSKELKTKYEVRSIPVRKGDVVKIMRGTFRTREGKVQTVYRKKWCIHVEKITKEKTNGSQIQIPIHPSNCMITQLKLDKDRKALLERKKRVAKQKNKHKEGLVGQD